MQISTKTGVVHAMLSSFDVPENTRSKRAEQQYRGAADRGEYRHAAGAIMPEVI